MATRGDIISKTIGGIVLGAMVVGGSILGVNVVNGVNARNAVAAQVAAQAAVPASYDGTAPDNAPASQMTDSDTAGAALVAQTEADLAAQAAAAQAAAVVAQQAAAAKAATVHKAVVSPTNPSDNPGGLPSGAVPPNIAGTNQPDSTACASSTLTWNGTESVCM